MDPIQILKQQLAEVANTLEILDAMQKSFENAVYLHSMRVESLSATIEALEQAQLMAAEEEDAEQED